MQQVAQRLNAELGKQRRLFRPDARDGSYGIRLRHMRRSFRVGLCEFLGAHTQEHTMINETDKEHVPALQVS